MWFLIRKAGHANGCAFGRSSVTGICGDFGGIFAAANDFVGTRELLMSLGDEI
jgi:hypothetical protein